MKDSNHLMFAAKKTHKHDFYDFFKKGSYTHEDFR